MNKFFAILLDILTVVAVVLIALWIISLLGLGLPPAIILIIKIIAAVYCLGILFSLTPAIWPRRQP